MPAPCYTPSNSQSQSHRRTGSRSQQEPESPTLEPTYPPNISKTNNNNDDINWQDLDKVIKAAGQPRQRSAHIYGASGFSDLPRQSNRPPQSQGYSSMANRGSGYGSSRQS
ncbi:hypothetical protein EYR41_004680 [Orbilia oligospora]|uniref:Uncharacterized protein n=1 Tax=Orbilia oligospora TaxID=2813651 RepID=A0A7C8K4N3_ORBOL|nr:hypothetical protein TWF751_011212 [Orbilia oligospora]TGJ72811.1 hypothetical protein EYR41_004680 [Orbilia oligospora]